MRFKRKLKKVILITFFTAAASQIFLSLSPFWFFVCLFGWFLFCLGAFCLFQGFFVWFGLGCFFLAQAIKAKKCQ